MRKAPQSWAADAGRKIKVGLDNFAVRAMGWKAPQLLDFAASLKCDTILISDLLSFESLDDGYLREMKAKADGLAMGLRYCTVADVVKEIRKI